MEETRAKIPTIILLDMNLERYNTYKDELDNLFTQILETGEFTPYEWSALHPFILFKLENVIFQCYIGYKCCKEFYEAKGQNITDNEYSELFADILDLAKKFTLNPPFTLQRICELISLKNPYSSSKFQLTAIFKLLNIDYDVEQIHQGIAQIEICSAKTYIFNIQDYI